MDRLTALRLFEHLAQTKSFSASARALHVKQSTASKWVARLEDEHGVRLVDRTTRATRLTEAGQRFLSGATQVLGAYDELTQALAAEDGAPRGQVRLSVPVVYGHRFVMPVVADFLRQHPAVRCDVALSDRPVNLVEEGFDLAVRVGVPLDTSAKARKLADGRRRLVASPAYLETHGRPRHPTDLRHHQCLVHGQVDTATVWRFSRRGRRSTPVPVQGRCSASTSEAVLTMARGGLGIALLASWLVDDDVQRGTLVALLPAYEAPPAPVLALMPAGRFMSATVRALVDCLAERLGPKPQPRR